MKEPFVFGRAVANEYLTDRKEETEKLIAVTDSSLSLLWHLSTI